MTIDAYRQNNFALAVVVVLPLVQKYSRKLQIPAEHKHAIQFHVTSKNARTDVPLSIYYTIRQEICRLYFITHICDFKRTLMYPYYVVIK